MAKIKFSVVRDGDVYLAADAAVGGKSFAMVPVGDDFACLYSTRAEAQAAADRASEIDGIETRMIQTSDRFEDVADTKYGPAW